MLIILLVALLIIVPLRARVAYAERGIRSRRRNVAEVIFLVGGAMMLAGLLLALAVGA